MNFFKEFSDVEARKEIPQPVLDIESILEIEREILSQYKHDERFDRELGEHNAAYQSLYSTMQEKMRGVTLTSEILQEYINARENNEVDREAIIRGMYSAALLEIISTTPPDTYTKIDGKGKRFNYLFYYIRNVKKLTLINIEGNRILSFAGNSGGTAEEIILQNMKGHGILSRGGYNGHLKKAVLSNINGNNTLSFAGIGLKGSAQYLTINNIVGEYTLSELGSYEGGAAEYIVVNKITGNHTLNFLAKEGGSAHRIIVNNIKGEDLLRYVGSNVDHIFSNTRGKFLKERQKIILSQIETIVENIHALSFEEQTKAHDEIAELQTEIFSEVKK